MFSNSVFLQNSLKNNIIKQKKSPHWIKTQQFFFFFLEKGKKLYINYGFLKQRKLRPIILRVTRSHEQHQAPQILEHWLL